METSFQFKLTGKKAENQYGDVTYTIQAGMNNSLSGYGASQGRAFFAVARAGKEVKVVIDKNQRPELSKALRSLADFIDTENS